MLAAKLRLLQGRASGPPWFEESGRSRIVLVLVQHAIHDRLLDMDVAARLNEPAAEVVERRLVDLGGDVARVQTAADVAGDRALVNGQGDGLDVVIVEV